MRIKRSGNSLQNRSPHTFRLHLLKLAGVNNHLVIAENVRGRFNVLLDGDNNRIIIGPNVRFNEPATVTMQCDNCLLEIGSETTSEGSTFHFRENGTSIVIGKDCMFARETNFWATDFHSILDQETGRRTNAAQRIDIGDHVWIGWGAKVLKNVRISEGAVVATSSVVTRDVAPHTIVIGVPAIEVRSKISWSRE